MDFALYGRVLRRFWPLVVAGVILAVSLSPSFTRARYVSRGHLPQACGVAEPGRALAQRTGFPYGRTLLPAGGTGTSAPPQYVNLAGLTDLYSQFANSDDVKQLMRQEGAPKTWSITAAPAVPTIQGATYRLSRSRVAQTRPAKPSPRWSTESVLSSSTWNVKSNREDPDESARSICRSSSARPPSSRSTSQEDARSRRLPRHRVSHDRSRVHSREPQAASACRCTGSTCIPGRPG